MRKEKGKIKKGKRVMVYAGACASGRPSPDDSVVDLSLHGRGKCLSVAEAKQRDLSAPISQQLS